MQLKNNNLLLTRGWINGAEIASDLEFDVINPATQEVVACVSDLGAAETETAISAAQAAFATWKNVALSERVALVERWATLLEDNIDDLAQIVCAENGKPLGEAAGEVSQCAALLRWYAQRAVELRGSVSPDNNGAEKKFTLKQPVGVVACITPWNFPAAAVIVKAGAAIVVGCTTIIKPSDETPLIALAFARLAADAGIPAGVFNVLPCKDPRPVGNALCESAAVRMLSFTGSTAVGKQLYAACANTMKRIAFELGGNAPFIVFDDADLEAAVAAAVGARFYNGGQICVGANRFYVHKKIYSEFADRLAARLAELNVGSGDDRATNIGPMINQAAIDRLLWLVSSAVELGAKVQLGGKRHADAGLFFEPTVLTGMTPDMPAYRTEIFGPVACLYEFDDEASVLAHANDTDAGLSAYVFTADMTRLETFSKALEAGVVGANSASIFANDMPFGGIKQSGIGKEHGFNCLEEFVETKSVFMVRQASMNN